VKYVVGIDECGKGALAGNLVVAATAFTADAPRVTATWRGISGDKTLVAGDSKGIKDPAHRTVLEAAIRAACPALAVIERTSAEIDQRLLGTVFPEAIVIAAARCLERLRTIDPTLQATDILVLVDGDVPRPDLPCTVQCIPDGDKLDWRIGAASIVAKATHDRCIDALHAEYPRWGFDRSRGYPTPEHKALLAERGPILPHRKTFRPVRAVLPRTIGIEE
jgi:ribonuclease HII